MAGGRAPPPRERLRRRGGRKVWDEEEEEGEVGMARWQGGREGGKEMKKTLSSSSFSPPSPFGAKLELEEVSESTGGRSRKRRRWKVHPTPRFPHRRGEGHQRSNFWCCEISTLLQEGWPKPLSFLGKQETAKAYCTCDARRGEKEGIRERKRFPFYLSPVLFRVGCAFSEGAGEVEIALVFAGGGGRVRPSVAVAFFRRCKTGREDTVE